MLKSDSQDKVSDVNEDEIKKHIRNWIKSVGRIDCGLGEIAIEKEIDEGGTALVFASGFAGGTAVKFLAESVSTVSNRYRRFLSEYVNLIRLVPTGVVVPLYYFAVQDLGGDLRVPYIVMERCAEHWMIAIATIDLLTRRNSENSLNSY